MKSLLELRDAAKNCRDKDYAASMREVADHIEWWGKTFDKFYTAEALGGLNSMWAHGHRLLKNVPKDDVPGGAGVREEALLQKVA